MSAPESLTAVAAPRRMRLDRAGAASTDLWAALLLTVVTAAATWRVLGLHASYVPIAVALHLGMGALMVWGLTDDMRAHGLGPANRVTLGRAVLAMPVLAAALQPGQLDTTAQWWLVGTATVVLLLDGLDGLVARRTGTQSAFGARFDMELDAALLMALSVLVWRDGRVGVWVLLIGSMRYAFVAASWIRSALAQELPSSFRRKLVCVLQGVVLLVALGPVVPTSVAAFACASGLAALTYSFAIDVRWALRADGFG